MRSSFVAGSFPESWLCKSEKQEVLERNGCAFRGQEALSNHETDLSKDCYCGRPNKMGAQARDGDK